jgi:hypothetical protein
MQNEAASQQQPPKQRVEAKAGQQQGHSAPATLVQPPAAKGNESGHGCPGTNQTKLDCNAVTAIAAIRQAAAAERFNNVVWVEIGVGAFTALFAYLAARWARRAAEAGIKSYKAFVAAEDAHLVLDFAQGPIGRWSGEDGVEKVNYSFKVTVSNVGRSAARLQEAIFSYSGGRSERGFGKTLKADSSMELVDDWLLINADDPTARVQISYATSLHPLTQLDVVVGLKVLGGLKATAYLVSSRTGSPPQK